MTEQQILMGYDMLMRIRARCPTFEGKQLCVKLQESVADEYVRRYEIHPRQLAYIMSVMWSLGEINGIDRMLPKETE